MYYKNRSIFFDFVLIILGIIGIEFVDKINISFIDLFNGNKSSIYIVHYIIYLLILLLDIIYLFIKKLYKQYSFKGIYLSMGGFIFSFLMGYNSIGQILLLLGGLWHLISYEKIN